MFIHQKSLLAQHFASKNFVDPVESLPPLSVPYCFLKDLTFLSLLVDIKYNIIFIYFSWFVFALFLHGLHSYSSNMDSKPIKALRKGIISRASGGSAPSTPARALPWTVRGLAAPPDPQLYWHWLSHCVRAGHPASPLSGVRLGKFTTCPSTQNA